jgi:ATP-binding cassette subfamily B (MDR/TAP) protein 1
LIDSLDLHSSLTRVGALFPLQAFLYARLVTAFQLTGSALISAGNFWALMWFIVALVVAAAYFVIGGLSTGLGEVSACIFSEKDVFRD